MINFQVFIVNIALSVATISSSPKGMPKVQVQPLYTVCFIFFVRSSRDNDEQNLILKLFCFQTYALASIL